MKMKWKIMDNEWIMNGEGVMLDPGSQWAHLWVIQDPGSQWGHPWLDSGDKNLDKEKLNCEGKIGNEKYN